MKREFVQFFPYTLLIFTVDYIHKFRIGIIGKPYTEALILTAYSGVPQIIPVRRSGGGGGHYRLRDGHRQAGRALCDSLGSTKGHGVVLPGTYQS